MLFLRGLLNSPECGLQLRRLHAELKLLPVVFTSSPSLQVFSFPPEFHSLG